MTQTFLHLEIGVSRRYNVGVTRRRTRKQKEAAKHRFTVYWSPSTPQAKRAKSEPVVKGQFKKGQKAPKPQKLEEKLPEFKAKADNLASIKRDLVRSLILASLILGTEVMIYLVLR